MKAFVASAVLLSICTAADTTKCTHANIYFSGWYAESVVAVPPQQLRDMAEHLPWIFRAVCGEQLQELVAVLALQHLRAERGRCRQNTNLVVDLFDDSGLRHGYRADGLYLWSLDNASARPIDVPFRKYFEKLFKFSPNGMIQPTVRR